MGLRDLIYGRSDLRQAFGARLLRPQAKLERGLQAPPRSTNYRMVAGAFRYLLGFHLERLNPQTRVAPWLAERGVEAIRLGRGSGPGVRAPGGHPPALKAAAYLADARRQYRAFIQVGRITDNLLVAAHRLAYLDAAATAGVDSIDWGSINYLSPDDAADLRALLALVEEHAFRTPRASMLQPSFVAAPLIGGADADLLVGDCLIDVRCNHEQRIDVRDFHHLLACWLLLGLGGLSGRDGAAEQLPVAAVGIYLARFGLLWRVPVEQVLPARAVPETVCWFVDVLCNAGGATREQFRALGGPLAAFLPA